MRPDVVWFGETPYQLREIFAAVEACQLFVSIGTSGTVAPASHLVLVAANNGARTVELNLEPSNGASYFDEVRHGPATIVVPAFVEELLTSHASLI